MKNIETFRSELLKTFSNDLSIKTGSITKNSTIQDFYNVFPNKNINLAKAFSGLFSIEIFDGMTTDQLFSGLYTLLTIIILILQRSQKNVSVYSSKYYNLNLDVSVLQILLGIITLVFATYQTRLYLNGKTFVLAEREFDIIVKVMSALLLLGTAITTLKVDSEAQQKIKKQKKKIPIPTTPLSTTAKVPITVSIPKTPLPSIAPLPTMVPIPTMATSVPKMAPIQTISSAPTMASIPTIQTDTPIPVSSIATKPTSVFEKPETLYDYILKTFYNN
jgi:hypothetical protein